MMLQDYELIVAVDLIILLAAVAAVVRENLAKVKWN